MNRTTKNACSGDRILVIKISILLLSSKHPRLHIPPPWNTHDIHVYPPLRQCCKGSITFSQHFLCLIVSYVSGIIDSIPLLGPAGCTPYCTQLRLCDEIRERVDRISLMILNLASHSIHPGPQNMASDIKIMHQ